MISLTQQHQALIEVPEGYSAWLPVILAAAGRAVEAHCNRVFEAAARTEVHDGTDSDGIPLRHQPVASISALRVGGAPVDLANVYADGPVLRWRGGFFPRGRGNVEVSYTAGSLPEDVALATVMTAQAMINAATLDPNTTGESTAGYSASFSPEGAGSIPRAAQSLLRPHIKRFSV
ncbi:hypothetical protein [Falsiroseomonas sp. CW058]|uniref:hypothetical protein n=1 Tax=Falsiroseomonas sp. CW058 TaxID=3388664 RepID=UPI003D30FF09